VAHRVTLIPGDGVGPEVVGAARRALEATGVDFRWDVREAGAATVARGDEPLPAAVVASMRECGVALKGPLATKASGEHRSANLALREQLALHTNVRPCRAYPGAPSWRGDFDVVVARMTGEDLYAGPEYPAGGADTEVLRRAIAQTRGDAPPPDAGVAIKALSHSAARRTSRAALAYARANGRARVTVVHKATVMPRTDGLFLTAAREVAAAEFPELELEERLVDTVCHDLVTRPERCDMLLAPVLYGDLLSDLCAGLAGGLGLAPGVILGDGCAVFEAAHGTAPRLAGRDRANPMAAMLCGVLLLRHLGEGEAAQRLEEAVAAVVAAGRSVTYDLRPDREEPGAAGTREAADAVVAALSA